jgi:hypothetical protein
VKSASAPRRAVVKLLRILESSPKGCRVDELAAACAVSVAIVRATSGESGKPTSLWRRQDLRSNRRRACVSPTRSPMLRKSLLALALGGALFVGCPGPHPPVDGGPAVTPSGWTFTARQALET